MSTELVYSDACAAASRRASDATGEAYPTRIPPSGADVNTYMRRDDDRREGYGRGHFDGQHAVIARTYGRGGPDPLAAVLAAHASLTADAEPYLDGPDVVGYHVTPHTAWTCVRCRVVVGTGESGTAVRDAHQADVVRAFLFGTEAGR